MYPGTGVQGVSEPPFRKFRSMTLFRLAMPLPGPRVLALKRAPNKSMFRLVQLPENRIQASSVNGTYFSNQVFQMVFNILFSKRCLSLKLLYYKVSIDCKSPENQKCEMTFTTAYRQVDEIIIKGNLNLTNGLKHYVGGRLTVSCV